MNTIKIILLMVTLAIGFPALAAELNSSIEVTLNPAPASPESGTNKVSVVLKSQDGSPVVGADLTWKTYMAAMGTMPYMEEFGEVVSSDKNGVYEIEYWLSMDGSWEIVLTIEKDGKTIERFYSLTTAIEGIKDKNRSAKARMGEAGAPPSGKTILDVGRERLQLIGVRFSQVEKKHLTSDIRAVGILEADDNKRAEIVPRYDGFVESLFVARAGESVKKGQAVASVYSPELVAAQSEHLISLRGSRSSSLTSSTKQKLLNLGMSNADIEKMTKSGKPFQKVTLRAPNKGTVVQIAVSKGF